MDYLSQIQTILMELLDIEDASLITPATYLNRDLDAESIDLLELAVALNAAFTLEINDNDIFLFNLRLYLSEAAGTTEEILDYLTDKLPHLSRERLSQIIDDQQNGPILKIEDIIAYLAYHQANG